MEQRRFILFVVLSTLLMVGWFKLGPIWFPKAFPQAAKGQPPAAADAAKQPDVPAAAQPADTQPADGAQPTADQPPTVANADAQPADLPLLAEFPNTGEVVLGSLQVDSGYFLEVRLNPQGAAIASATLNDPRFITDDGKRQQLKVVGPAGGPDKQTLQSDVAAIDAQLAPYKKSLRNVVWEVVRHDDHSAEFRYPSPDGTLEVRKTYKLNQGDPKNRDGDYIGYLLDVTVEIRNLGQQPQKVQYVLQGPVGLPLENAANTRTFIDIKVGTADDPADPVQYTAHEFVKQREDAIAKNDFNVISAWRDPLAYVGVDVQYFAALLFPQDPQNAGGRPEPTFAVVKPDLVGDVNAQHPERTDISLRLESREIALDSGAAQQDSFRLFLGPKRPELLTPLNARGVITFGWFSFVAVGMVYALNFFHEVFRLPYGLAIVLLTVIVRACMFPITRKQAVGAKKMKELQPKLQELKTKYAKEPEKFWQAQRELFRKHNYSPLSGCLPLVLQLPIFIGLYSALSFDVDLRMAPFLWIDNLAAPDQLFSFGRELPLLRWTHFNLLPFITIALWIAQQKIMMPPPATEEQALQYKVMNYMMIFIGYMIYPVPAGLCVYFITSTLWGISERKLIDYLKIDEKKTEPAAPIETPATPVPSPPEASRKPGWLERLVAAADEAKRQGTGRSNESAASSFGADRKDSRGGKKKNRPKR